MERKALELFAKDYNCSESVFLVGMKYLGLGDNVLVPRLATGFGGGLGRIRSVCGAFSGAAMALGAKYGRTLPEDDRDLLYGKVQELNARFTEKFGSIYCHELIGVDLGSPEGLRQYKEKNMRVEPCSRFVGSAVNMLLDLL